MVVDSRGSRFIAAGVALFLGTLLVSAALAGVTGDVTASDEENRETLVGSQGGGARWEKHGSVYQLNGTDTEWTDSSADSYFGATKLDNGSVLAAFMDTGYKKGCGQYSSPCTKTGFRIIEPQPKPNVVYEWSFPVRTGLNSEVHDVEPLPGGGFVLTDMDRERILVVENGKVAWQWNASSFYEAPPDATQRDWLHINDVDRIGQGRYLVSVRNANQLLIVERGKGVVEVINKDRGGDDSTCLQKEQLYDANGDGDVRCGDSKVLNHQHNPQWLGNGAVLVADSDNDRVVELHRSESGDWKPSWTLKSAGGKSLYWPRDADRLPNGNTLVTDTLNKRIFEVTEKGDVVWSYSTKRIPYEADRLPYDDQTKGVKQYSSGTVGTGGSIPVLTLLVTGIRGAAPWIPAWYAEPQVGVTLVSIALVLAGVVFLFRER